MRSPLWGAKTVAAANDDTITISIEIKPNNPVRGVVYVDEKQLGDGGHAANKDKGAHNFKATSNEGEEFGYWLIDGVKYTSGNNIDLQKSTTVTAVWCEKVNFISGDKTVETRYVPYNDTYLYKFSTGDLPEAPANDKLTFAGWYYKNDKGKLETKFNTSGYVKETTNVYAKWLAKVSFVSDGKKLSDQEIVAGEKVVKPETDPTKDGFIFAGWYADEKCTTAFDFNAAINENTTIYAKWTTKENPKPDPDPTPNPEPKELPFTDINPSAWYINAVKFVYNNGIMKGTGNGTTFEPNTTCSRAMFVTILCNANKGEAVTIDLPFEDVPEKSWYRSSVMWAVKNNITKGISATKFGGNDNVTREQVATFLYSYATLKGLDTSNTTELDSFPDAATVSGWAAKQMKWANACKIVNGKAKDGQVLLDPKANATRAEVAKMIVNFIEYYK